VADTAALNRLLEPEIESLGYRLVRVAFVGGKSDRTLQIMAEKPETRQLDLSDCEVISRRLSDLLDEKDPIDGTYRLEVSSPGIDRPLTRPADFDDWKGHEARIALAEPLNGRKQFSGTLKGTGEGNVIHLAGKDGQDYVIPFASIHSAKLLLTDELIASTAPLSTEGADTIQTVED
jgi:ribosome maturation factor RimP